jgi:2-C-methyl-D-erythritol 4-phosphate cytidylyltransferase
MGRVDDEQALGWVPLEGRGSLPFALVHGESLVAAASWAVGEAGVLLFDASVTFDQVRDAGRPLLLHDPLCPLTPPDFLTAAVERCVTDDAVVVGFRPVTDTVKQQDGDVLGATVDRAGLRAVTSPVVVPASVLAGLDRLDAADLPALVATLAAVHEVVWLEAPPLGRRIASEDDLRVLEALSRSLGRSPDRSPS